MRKRLYGGLTICLGLALSGLVQADGQESAKAILDKAIKAQGGDKLVKMKAAIWKGKGVVHINGEDRNFTAEWSIAGPDKYKLEAEGDGFKLVRVLNGDKGWSVMGGESRELEGNQLAALRHEALGHWVTMVAPLQENDYSLKPLPEAKVDNRPAEVLSVTRKDHAEIKLYFDKEKGLLLKSETKIKRGENELDQETSYSSHKEMNGIVRAQKVGTKIDGNPFVEIEIAEFKPVEKLDDKVFAKPE